MTVPTATFQTFTATAVKEDFEDVVYDISPTKTPLLTMCKRETANQRYHQWVTDSLKTPGANVVIEGDDAANDTSTPAVVYGNYAQLMDRVAGVSTSLDASDSYGNVAKLAYQVRKRATELKLDLDFALSQNQDSTAGAAASAREMGSIESWLTTYTSLPAAANKSAATVPGFSSGIVAAPTDATGTGTATQAILESMLSQLYSQGAEPTVILVPPTGKVKVSGFSSIATRNRDYTRNQQVAIINGADLYVGNFGELAVVASRQVRSRVMLLLDPEYLGVAYLQPFRQEKLAKTGHADRVMVSCEATLVVKNPAAHGQIRDINYAV